MGSEDPLIARDGCASQPGHAQESPQRHVTKRTRLFEAAFVIVGAVPQQESPHDEVGCCCGEDEIDEDDEEDEEDEDEEQQDEDECGGDGDEEEEQQEEMVATGVLIGESGLLLDALVFWDEQHDGLAALLSIAPSSSLKVIRIGLGAIAHRGRITVKETVVNATNLL
ncbi:hypothetical protein K492DRAFT_185070 [Lichtheimia hyalospora FSU 10163]|nr:hypothetical protein K492DRAFT_185070 [Lichtheimia hyalospora FSU 10163]